MFDYIDWRGNKVTFEQSRWLYFTIIGIVVFSILLVWIYKQKITQYFANTTTILKIKNRHFEILVGISIMVATLIRIIILEIGDYILKWEYIPLHFCRFFFISLGYILIFDKKHWIKYFGIFSIMGGIIALSFGFLGYSKEFADIDLAYPETRNVLSANRQPGFNWGYDTVHWWDYLFMHLFVIVAPVIIWRSVANSIYISKKSAIYSALSLSIFAVFIFFLNFIVSIFNPPVWFEPNWFYLGKSGINTLGILTKWYYSIFTMIILGNIANFIFIIFYFLQDKIEFVNKETSFWKIKKIKLKKSNTWLLFKNN